MANDKKPDLKKSFPGGFVWLLMALFLFMMMLQNYVDTKFASVGFSYELEHLVNLQLIKPEESKKTAGSDNLVTFSGEFREKLTEEGKARYKYLELLNKNHELTQEKEIVSKELLGLRAKVKESADRFLALSGIEIPEGGYEVVDELFNTPGQDHSLVIRELSRKNYLSLKDLSEQFKQVKEAPDNESLTQFGKDLAELITDFRSQTLGIGSEPMKNELKALDQKVVAVNESARSINDRLQIYTKAMDDLSAMVALLNKPQDHIRLLQLRSVRSYNEAIDRYTKLTQDLETNQTQLDKARMAVSEVVWFFNNKELSTRALEKQDSDTFHQWFLNAKEEWNQFPENKGGYFKAPDQPLNKVLEKTFRSEEPTPNYVSYIFTLLPIFLVLMVLYFVFSRQMKGMGSGAMNFGKSPARLIMPKGENKVTFKDVAGAEEAKEELEEVVDFLKNPHKFTALGGRIPKGVLCIGPPGTGKTLIARAVAGEADRPFFSISGSDFVEMFVGVGASRIRDLFDQAKKNAPCIVFIDEIDAVGRHRGAGVGGGHDEREQTLNQLLVEMDGFEANEGVILMAATNRPDVLDKALLRPGRFDRHVVIGLPDIKGRFDILKVHAKRIKLDPDVDLMSIAKSTPGCSGADLANILNEAALLAARKGRSAVTRAETVEARDKVLYGKERRSMELDVNEKRSTAYHESGHAIVGLKVEHSDPVDKVTIIPRGMSLGSTMFLPEKNKTSHWRKELLDNMAVLMGGRAAELIFVGDVSSGASNDIERATEMARNMVCHWGMNDVVGPVAYSDRADASQGVQVHDKTYSEETAQIIDAEVKKLLQEANEYALKILKENKEAVELMTEMLIEFETLDAEDVKKIINGEWTREDKQDRLKKQDELHKKSETNSAATPPPPPEEEKGNASPNNRVPNPI
ncbi:MAG: ATP-dependent zinc metalloprotease FtsH [Chlamydiia bacterium]|nr:ATP-dependent zinc metalloprotease FtsH [Chlamydiia bacterium]